MFSFANFLENAFFFALSFKTAKSFFNALSFSNSYFWQMVSPLFSKNLARRPCHATATQQMVMDMVYTLTRYTTIIQN